MTSSVPPTKILVAEDDPLIRETLVDLLSMHDFEVVAATNGREALEAFSRVNPDIILSDIRMPEMDGYELLRSIHRQLPWMPVILLSAKAAASDIRMGMELGADDYLTKPFDIEKVVQSVRTRVERAKLVAKRMDSRGAFLRRYLPHELRTPLAGIVGFGDILQHDLESGDALDPEALKSYAEGIMKSADRLLDIVENFTLWADLSTGNEDLNKYLFAKPEPKFTIVLKEQLLACAARYGRETDTQFLLEHTDLPYEPKFLNRIACNLFDNACKFSLPGSVIKVAGRVTADDYVLSFENQRASDMEPAPRPDFFEQPDRPRIEQQGLGLGLALGRLYAAAINGRLDTEVDPARKTIRLSLCLPLQVLGERSPALESGSLTV